MLFSGKYLIKELYMSEIGLYSLAPVIITLVLSVWSRNVVLGLFVGVFSGVLLLNGPNLFTGMSIMVEQYLVAQASNSANMGILLLMIFVAGLVGLMEKSGGAAAFAGRCIHTTNRAHSSRRKSFAYLL